MNKKIYAEFNLNLELKESDFETMRKRYHFDNQHKTILQTIYSNLKQAVKPVGNITFVQSHAKERLSFVEKKEYSISMISLGAGVDQLLEQYHLENKVFEAYALDCLALELLNKSYEQMEGLIYQICGQWPEKYRFIGDNYPMSSLDEIFQFVPQTMITHNKAYALLPSKSVVFLSTLSKEKRNCVLHMCSNCKNKTCDMRKEKAKCYGEIRIFSGGKEK